MDDETVIYLKEGEYLMKEGDDSRHLYWCLKGELAITKKVRDMKMDLGRIKSGELVGELSFIDQQNRSASIKALEDCQLIRLEYSEFQDLLSAQPKWIRKMLETLAKKVRHLSEV